MFFYTGFKKLKGYLKNIRWEIDYAIIIIEYTLVISLFYWLINI